MLEPPHNHPTPAAHAPPESAAAKPCPNLSAHISPVLLQVTALVYNTLHMYPTPLCRKTPTGVRQGKKKNRYTLSWIDVISGNKSEFIFAYGCP